MTEKSKQQKTATPPADPGQRTPIQVDDANVAALYANFCRVTHTPEELIIDFGLNPHVFGPGAEPVKISERIVTNFYTAKRLLFALQIAVRHHEEMFGVLEVDVQKRLHTSPTKPSPAAPPPPAP